MTEKKTEPTDQQLVVRVQKGDKRAFDLLVLSINTKCMLLSRDLSAIAMR